MKTKVKEMNLQPRYIRDNDKVATRIYFLQARSLYFIYTLAPILNLYPSPLFGDDIHVQQYHHTTN